MKKKKMTFLSLGLSALLIVFVLVMAFSQGSATLSGFADPLYFSRVFRETVGVAPAHYQKKQKG